MENDIWKIPWSDDAQFSLALESTPATFITFHFLSFPLLCAAPNPMKKASLIPIERIEKAIYLIRGEKVMLDRDLAALYEVETRAVNQAVGRNRDRFPADFMFELTRE